MNNKIRKAWNFKCNFVNSGVKVLQDPFYIEEHNKINFQLKSLSLDFSNKGWGDTVTLFGKDKSNQLICDVSTTLKKQNNDYHIICYLLSDFAYIDTSVSSAVLSTIKAVEIEFTTDENALNFQSSKVKFLDKFGIVTKALKGLEASYEVNFLETDTLLKKKVKELRDKLKSVEEELEEEKALRTSLAQENDFLAASLKPVKKENKGINTCWDYNSDIFTNYSIENSDQLAWANEFISKNNKITDTKSII